MKNLRFIWIYVSQVKVKFILAVLLLAAETLSSLATIYLQKYIIDDVIISGQYHLLIRYTILFAAALLLFVTIFSIAPMVTQSVEKKIRSSLTNNLMKKITTTPISIIYKEGTSKYVNYLSADASKFSQLLAEQIPRWLQQGLKLSMLIYVIAGTNLIMFLAVTILSLLYAILMRSFGKQIKSASKQVLEDRTKMVMIVEEGISSTREVLVFNQMEWEEKRYTLFFEKVYKSLLKYTRKYNVQYIVSEPLKWGTRILVLGYGGYLTIIGQMSIGLFVVIYQLVQELTDTIQEFFQFTISMSSDMASNERILSFFEVEDEVDGDMIIEGSIKEICFNDVSFYYVQDKQILDGLNLHIEGNAITAFVGASGSGKSTIAHLLTKLYKPTNGGILINNVSIERLKKEELMKRISIVLQEPYLFPISLADNILLGRDLPEERLFVVCEMMHLNDLIHKLPDGLNTVIGERGSTLSGGEKQRISIARAVIGDPDILILDESTSALDLETEWSLMNNLKHIRQGKCTIIIAHRLSSIKNADVIYVINSGNVIEKGTHDSLFGCADVSYNEFFIQKNTI